MSGRIGLALTKEQRAERDALILKLHNQGLSRRVISERTGYSMNTVGSVYRAERRKQNDRP